MKNLLKNEKDSTGVFLLSYEEVKAQIAGMLQAPCEFDDSRNLLELGLSSLQIMRLVNEWRKMGSKATFAELISSPCLGGWWPLLNKNCRARLETKEDKTEKREYENINTPFPLTDVQYAYWIGRREDQYLGGVGCHGYLEADGENVDSLRLEEAWEKLLMRHPMLRARFLQDGRQEVMGTPALKKVRVNDLRYHSKDRLSLELKSIRDRLSHRLLEIEKGEVAGLQLSLLPGNKTRLHFDIDLLVADVQSFQIILRDLAAAYARGLNPPAPVDWSFAGYLKQEEQRRLEDRERSRQYWSRRLPSLPQAPALPLKERPENIKKPVFKRRESFVKEPDWEVLKKRSAASRVTPAMVLLTAYAEVIERWSASPEFLINIPLFDRQTAEAGIENVVADFTNLLLLAVNCSDSQSFLEHVQSIQRQFHEDVANTAYSGVQVQRDMARLHQGEKVFAPVVFSCNLGVPLINDEFRKAFGGISYMISQTPQVWLDFQLFDMDNGLLLIWDAIDDLFPEGLIDQMFTAYKQLIGWLAADNNDWSASPDISPASRQLGTDNGVKTAASVPGKCLHVPFFEFAALNPQKTVLIESVSNRVYLYGELSSYALQVAAFLRENGVEEGEPVAVTLPRGTDQIAGVLGVLAAGACYVPVSPEQPFARRESMHRKAAIKYILTGAGLAEAVAWPEGSAVMSIEDAASTVPMAAPLIPPPGNSAYIIFTSGSTGEPKGVEISHSGAWNTIGDINRRYDVGSDDTGLAVSSLDFDLSVYDMFGLLSVGGSLVLLSENTRRDAAYWLKLLNERKVTIWNSVPVLLDMLLVAAESKRQKTPALRLALLSGDWIGMDLPSRLKNVAENACFVAMGGATEASIWSNYYDVVLPLPSHWVSIPYGRPLTGQAYRVVDKKGRDCPDWVPGELWIGGAGVAKGYIGDPELTAGHFLSRNNTRWYRTGDTGRYWPDGNIEFLGRQDFQVKIRGHRIELGDIEAALKKHPGVRDSVVAAIGDPHRNKRLVAYIVPDYERGAVLLEDKDKDHEKMRDLWAGLLNTGHSQTQKELHGNTGVEDFPAFEKYTEAISIIHICRALKNAGAYCAQGERYTFEGLVEHCKITPRYKELLRQWLESLESEGVIRKDRTNAYINNIDLPVNGEDNLIAGREYSTWKKYIQGLLNFLHQFERSSTDLLKGNIDPLKLFFSDEYILPDDFAQALPGAERKNDIAKKLLEAAVQEFPYPGPVRILEIGARSIDLTKAFLSLLPPAKIAYTCTDNSVFFINNLNKRLKDFTSVRYRQLDINQNPLNQGYDAHSYDIIIASNSLHRSRNIKTALENVQSLIAPGGILLLTEITKNSRLQQISAGFLEDGFTNFEDERRMSHKPLFSTESWLNVLKSGNFPEAAVFPGTNHPESIFNQHVIVAQSAYNIEKFKPESLEEFLGQILPQYMIPSAFIPLKELPLTCNGKIDRKALPVPAAVQDKAQGKPFVAPETQVEVSLSEIWTEILKIAPVSTNDNYFELGGDSLLATQLNAMVREKFNVELSLESIFKRPVFAEQAESIDFLLKSREDMDIKAEQILKIIPAREQWSLPFPLTDVQQSYWIGRSGVYSLGNVSTHCYFEMEGRDLEITRINEAWQRLIDHHSMMRAVILPDGQSQKICEHVPPYRIKVYDLREKDQKSIEYDLKNIREEMYHQRFSTDQWPLFDVRASRLGNNCVRLHISFDNIVFDGRSMFYIFKEWRRLYNDPDASLPSLELSFRDYVMALEQIKKTELYQRDVEYWNKRLPDLPPAPDLPLAQDPNLLPEQRFSRFEKRLDGENWQKLKKRAAEHGLTASGILLAAYAEVLGAWSRRPKFTINLTRFNRLPLHPQIKDVIGDFTSLTLLSVDNSSGSTFLERSRNLQRQLWQDLDHPCVSGVFVEREFRKICDRNQAAVMPVVFTSGLGVEHGNEDESGQNYLGKIIYGISQTPQVWLDHQVSEQEGGLVLSWDAIKDIFPEGLLDDMFEAYCKLLKCLTDDEKIWMKPAASLISIPGLEKRIEANDTNAPVPSDTLAGLFAKQAAKHPAQPAVISSCRTLTYEELSLRADLVRSFLVENGVKPNTLVAVVMEKGWEQVVAVLGILKAGAAYLPVASENPDERIRLLLHEGDIGIALTQSWIDGKINWPQNVARLSIDQMALKERDNILHDRDVHQEDLAYVIYTSGSTGSPKGVMIDHRGAVNTVLDINRRFCVGTEDRVLAISGLNFDLSVYDIFGMLAAGGAIVLPDAKKIKDPAHWLELIQKEKVTVWNTVPAFMKMLMEYASKRDGFTEYSLRLTLLSGDWIPLDLPDKIKAYFKETQVIGLGGATEASIWSNLFPIGKIHPGWKSIPYGRPLDNQRYYVLNELMEDCPVWVPGQLYIGGIGVARGYWKNDEKTQEKFICHPRTGERIYCTGDLGRYLPDGNIEFLGREDFQVKINGYRIELGEIETMIKRFDGVRDAVVIAPEDPDGSRRLVGYLVLDGQRPEQFKTERLSEAIKEKLPHYMVPAAYVLLHDLPVSHNGKVDRKELAKLGREKELFPDKARIAPYTEVQMKIADVWKEVLKYESPGIDDDFFEYGGDSLRAIQFVNLLKERCKIELSLQSLFEAPCIALLAQLAEKDTLLMENPSENFEEGEI